MSAWTRTRWRTRVEGAWPRGRAGALVRLSLDGVVGVGDAAPMPGFADDDLPTAERALEAAFTDSSWRRAALESDLPRIADLAASMAGVSPAAACAMETAVLDLAARRRGVSVAALLAEFVGTDRLRDVPVNIVVSPSESDPEARVTSALDDGIRAVKLKVGRHAVEQEADIARRLRRVGGSELELRLDANAAWSLESAGASLEAFADIAPAFCEQPVPPGELPRLVDPAVPFAADESVALPSDLDRLLDGDSPHPGLAAVVLKPMALGGALACLAIAERARRARVPVVVTHLLDGPVGAALAAELAAAIPGDVLASGLSRHPALEAWDVEVPQLGRAMAGSAGRPGLGLEVPMVPTCN